MKLYYKLCEYRDGNLVNYYTNNSRGDDVGNYDNEADCRADCIRASSISHNQILVIAKIGVSSLICGIASYGNYVEV